MTRSRTRSGLLDLVLPLTDVASGHKRIRQAIQRWGKSLSISTDTTEEPSLKDRLIQTAWTTPKQAAAIFKAGVDLFG